MVRGSGLRILPRMVWLAALMLLASPSLALAASDTMGGVIGTLAGDIWQPFWHLLLGLGFLLGLYLVAAGLAKLRDTGGPGSRGAADGILRLVGGALLIALPDTVNIGVVSFYNSITGHAMQSGGNGPGAVAECLQSMGGGSPLTCVAKNVASNLVPVFIEVSFGLFYLVGVAMILHAIYTMATSHAAGHNQTPKGWLARVVIGFLICNVPHLMLTVQNTLGIRNGTVMDTGFSRNSSLLAYTADSSAGVLAQYAELIGYCFQILVMFGVIAVWRGIMYLRAFADGSERGGMGPGITHIIGGVLLANAKWTTCIVVNTFFGSGLGFCG